MLDKKVLTQTLAAFTIFTATAPAWTQGRLDADSLRLWGGAYSTNCANCTIKFYEKLGFAMTGQITPYRNDATLSNYEMARALR
ncbi:MAG: hypothetical protein FJ143_15875 [Deltaproteobacteria bacterium]|nr:hypothetical protein [Deltaproteobacteria bacterium]MBM4299215.1 hypothetical protein [Deltaproteobacteria bacterium]